MQFAYTPYPENGNEEWSGRMDATYILQGSSVQYVPYPNKQGVIRHGCWFCYIVEFEDELNFMLLREGQEKSEEIL